MALRCGTSAVALVTDLLVQRGLCDYRQAFDLAQAFDHELSRYGWIDTLDGATFARQPAAESADHKGGRLWPEKLI